MDFVLTFCDGLSGISNGPFFNNCADTLPLSFCLPEFSKS